MEDAMSKPQYPAHLKCLRWVTVELPVFFFSFSIGIAIVRNKSIYLEKTCREGSVLFGNGTVFSDEVCDSLTDVANMEEERYVEYQVARLGYISAALQATPAIIMALFAGAWSDVYGRRFLIMFPLLGFLILYVVLMTLSLVDGIPADFLLFESLQDLTGGFSVLMLGAFAHVCDVTTPKSRMSRMCFLEMIFILGLELGLGLSEPLYTIAGYAPAYVISIVLILTGVASVPFFVDTPKHVVDKDTGIIIKVTLEEEEALSDISQDVVTRKQKFTAFFRPGNVVDTIRAGFRPRTQGRRWMLWALLLAFALIDLIREGEEIVDILYVREKFSFADYDDFSNWWMVFHILLLTFHLLTLGLMVPVLKQIYHVSDAVVLIIASCGSLFRTIIFLSVGNRDNLYIGGFLDAFNMAGIVAIRSAVASLVDREEIGRVFGIMAVVQAVTKVLAHLYTMLFTETQDWHMGLAYCINATFLVMTLVIAIIIFLKFKKHHIGVMDKPLATRERDETTMKRLSSVCPPDVQHDVVDVVTA